MIGHYRGQIERSSDMWHGFGRAFMALAAAGTALVIALDGYLLVTAFVADRGLRRSRAAQRR